MHLTPREQERLTIFTLAELARRRRARGRRLNAPESIALICDEILELAWDGASLAEVVAGAQAVLGPDDVMEGVPALVTHVQVEALFPNGTALVAVDAPIAPAPPGGPGAVRTADEPIEINPGHERERLVVTNGGPLTVFVSSHFPLSEVNEALTFDRDPTGLRLDIPAGTATAFRPGQTIEVQVIRA
ncbi:urease subunit gamma [Nonomuraea sp. NPDC050328]|uniref:urease subunit gamma n=1 Tax=Nonomuraea sp. NPDC050328 TaxID=3364361 RepID=UPI0037BB9CDC